MAKQLEENFGAPQDVEWVIYDDVAPHRPIQADYGCIRGDASAEAAHRSVHSDAILTGVPASSGIGSGPVHLVFNIEQALRLESGSVLVTPMTNPDMVVAMRNSAAIVTDVGGIICHAGIVSRELGLPCVVGTETATTTLAGGEPVTVNGSSGRIYRGRIETEMGSEVIASRWSGRTSGPLGWQRQGKTRSRPDRLDRRRH